VDFTEPQDAPAIREAVRALCEGFPGDYWRALEPDRYPSEFVAALTEQGWLAALIPETYGGGSPPASCACRPSRSPSLTPARTPRRSRPGPSAVGTATW
jgi:alkylation response protein AidB-like acyl-CoA dehydrogenase